MRQGVRVALDIGAKRIGVARCDRDGILAVPLDTIAGDDPSWIMSVQRLLAEYDAIECIVGDPVSLSGTAALASRAVRERAQSLADATPGLAVRMVDERLTTAQALKDLRSAGKTARTSRASVDAQAAVGILEFALEFERRTGTPAGELL